jgi:hypothetical protein
MAGQTAGTIRKRITYRGERLWRLEDFEEFSPTAVAQAFSRLAREGFIERLSKGTYYRSRETAFGRSRPSPAAIQKLASRRNDIFPAGTAAASLLGFTTQVALRGEVSTSGLSLPRALMGADTVIHTRRPQAWTRLSSKDAALLDFLRHGGRTSELSPDETIRRTLAICSDKGRLGRLLEVADSEPPRVRAMLGAIAENLGRSAAARARLRASLNPLSRFDFGVLQGLSNASGWQARGER